MMLKFMLMSGATFFMTVLKTSDRLLEGTAVDVDVDVDRGVLAKKVPRSLTVDWVIFLTNDGEKNVGGVVSLANLFDGFDDDDGVAISG